jgi:hypothetical protein
VRRKGARTGLKSGWSLTGACGDGARRAGGAPGYDRLQERRWGRVPLWGMKTWFLYAPRRVECAEHGVVVEYLPWHEGKRSLTTVMMGFFGSLGATAELARDGRGLSDLSLKAFGRRNFMKMLSCSFSVSAYSLT